jgi:hypothetical protein
MAAVYRQNIISDDRLIAVTEHVRSWLWPKRKRVTMRSRGG